MSYRFVSHDQLARELCRALHKPGMYFSTYVPDTIADWAELIEAAPYLRDERPQTAENNCMQCIVEEAGVILCDTDEERDALYNQTVGDDGPTEANPYNGPCRVYALTISADGEFLNENT